MLALLVAPILIWWVDEPLAELMHGQGGFLKTFFAEVMCLHDAFIDTVLMRQPLYLWLALLLLFCITRLLRQRHSTIWLVAVLTLVSSQAVRNLLAVYFNRPRPFQVFSQLGLGAYFWQPVGQFDAFPSGHATGAAALLLPWTLRFSKARPWLLGWLGLVCLGRVVLEYHWLSDVVAGASIGLLLTCGWELGTWWLRPVSPEKVELVAAGAT
ncbi:phosphatase PAP2 family protein [Hymenobacter norwichensis]|uniref:phosphatase PAP2 family protein n=1 Tax=Hymenobacter norwichensis TaxID=223903 RepID=UPI00146BC72F|nr:phosphatase PAP2 family protein [Hymenobacter norwichensis]